MSFLNDCGKDLQLFSTLRFFRYNFHLVKRCFRPEKGVWRAWSSFFGTEIFDRRKKLEVIDCKFDKLLTKMSLAYWRNLTLLDTSCLREFEILIKEINIVDAALHQIQVTFSIRHAPIAKHPDSFYHSLQYKTTPRMGRSIIILDTQKL